MRKVLALILTCCVGIGVADAAVRDASTVSRAGATQPTVSRTTASKSNVVSRAIPTTASRPNRTAQTTRTATSRAAVIRSSTTTPTGRTASTKSRAVTNTQRAAIVADTTNSKTFGTGYNTCRDAYFTCMDQFCATTDDTYRRCVCSSRLYEIKKKQSALAQSADQLQDFKDLNIEAIPKTAAEVKAMQNASEGEMVASVIKDKSSSIAQLAGISAVLSNTKSKSLSTAGQLDIAGDINAIWATTDLTSGLNVSNLTGEILYSAVHSQCVNLVADHCSSKSLLNMVVSAYSMYIENDCSLLANSLDKKKTAANASIRETEREMNVARLDNYDAHNSSSINDCIAMVRRDVTTDAACGADYVHCLDTTGLYLNKTTGAPIYTSNFYQLGSTVSLSGDILTNQTNIMLVSELNRKRIFAEKSLDTCRDMADRVWDEFLRQAVIEIYQGQQNRIRDVKNECLDVVNQCYDAQSNALKDFSNVKEQLLIGARLELSEELCREKLDACSNLYGGGPDGMQELLTTMYDITTQKIAQNCFTTLQEYAAQMCAVPSSDSLHSYPYACRAYAPGEQRYATNSECNNTPKDTTSNASSVVGETPSQNTPTGSGYQCSNKTYTKCNNGYYMAYNNTYNPTPQAGNQCIKCPATGCPTSSATDAPTESTCGDYVGSLYQKLVRYARQACMRPSRQSSNSELPTTLLQDVNATMDLIKASMATSLKAECERLGGYWVASPWTTNTDKTETGIKLFSKFYNETGANKKWGYCADPETVATYYTGTSESGNGTDGDEHTNAHNDSDCLDADNNNTVGGCVAVGFRCNTGYRVYNGQCIEQCDGGTTDLGDCPTPNENGTSGGCAAIYCRCPQNKQSSYDATNHKGTCLQREGPTPL